MAPKKQVTKTDPRNAELGLERIVFFSDAVMAIAITLLAIDLKISEAGGDAAASSLPDLLDNLTPKLMSFVISFTVIGIYWMSHHRYFGFIKRYDNRLIILNLLFLLFIVLMPFAASLLGQYNHLPFGVIAYAAEVAATGLSISALWWYASRHHRLVDEGLDEQFIQVRNRIGLAVPAVFLLSIPCTLISPMVGMFVWWAAPLIAFTALQLYKHQQKPTRI